SWSSSAPRSRMRRSCSRPTTSSTPYRGRGRSSPHTRPTASVRSGSRWLSRGSGRRPPTTGHWRSAPTSSSPSSARSTDTEQHMAHTTVIYEGTPGRRLQNAHLEVVGIADDDGLDDAVEQAIAAGAGRIELCGGMGAAHLARARELAAGRVPVGLLRYGFESLELIVLYKQCFAAGTPGPAAFLFPEGGDTEPDETQDVADIP